MSVDLETKTMNVKAEQPIKSFEVWWRSPFGLFPDLDRATASCSRVDYDVNLSLVSVVVAVAANGDYEELRR